MVDAKRMIKEAADRAASEEIDRAADLQWSVWEGILEAIDSVESKLRGELLTDNEIKLGVSWALNEIIEQRQMEREE